MRNKTIIAAGLMLALGNGLTAGQGSAVRREEPQRQGPEIERSAVNFATAWRPRGASSFTRVVGSVIDIRQMPVPQATVQLRNLNNGNIEQTSQSGDDGSYAFDVEQAGTYVVEMLRVDGQVLALSNAGQLSRYETLQTIVQLPGRWDISARSMIMPQNVTTFFGMSAETSMTAATLELAIGSSIPPANPGVPVSP